MAVLPISHPLLRPPPPSSSPPRAAACLTQCSSLRLCSMSLPQRRLLSLTRLIPKSSADDNGRGISEASETTDDEVSDAGEAEKVAAELKELMEEKRRREGQSPAAVDSGVTGLLAGVGEEVNEIEWPPLGRVLRTTGVVLAVIAGSSVALLTVNAVLAELSDRVFAGKGVQDFFGN